jgi:hypothetical protein
MYDPPERITLRGLLLLWQSEFALPAQPSLFMRREVLDDVGELDESLNFTMDYDLWLRAVQAYDFTYSDEIWSEYRIHEGSKTGQGMLPFIDEIFQVGEKYCHQLSRRDHNLYKYYGKRALIARYYLDQAYEARKRNKIGRARQQLITAFNTNPWAIFGNRGVLKFLLQAVFRPTSLLHMD